LHSSATAREQAAIVFDKAAKMVRMSPTLKPFVQVRDTAKELLCPDLGTRYRALSADATTAYGLNPALNIHDELGQVKGPRSSLYEALETSTGAQDEPLSIIISTQAPTDADLLSVLIDDAAKERDPRTVLRMNAAPSEMDPFSKEAIRAANPAFDVFMNKREVLAMAEDARQMPSKQAEFENLILNRRVEVNNPFISKVVWKACGGQVIDSFKGLPVWGGLDLSECNDLTAFVAVAPVDGVWHVKPTFWLPGEGLRERARLDRVPYDIWARDGKLVAIEGARSVEYEYVARFLRGFVDENDVRKIAFDRWGFRHLRPWLLKEGFSETELEELFEEFGQGFQSMSPALRTLESDLLNRKVAHGDHPVLGMCAANAVVQRDPAGGRKLNKAKSRGRIDGMISLTMARSAAGTYEQPVPFDVEALVA
jgi:phage terminase large subunit-like protein